MTKSWIIAMCLASALAAGAQTNPVANSVEVYRLGGDGGEAIEQLAKVIVGDSGNVKTRAFCPTCGSPVYMTFAAMPDLFTVHAASLDDPTRYQPQMVTYGVSGLPWDRVDATLRRFDRMPG